jgi:hypothetical protein
MLKKSDTANKFLSLTAEDLKKMANNSISKRNNELENWENVVSNIFIRHPFIQNGKIKDKAHTGILLKTIEDFIANKIASSFPINAKFENDSANLLTPALSIVEKEYKEKVLFGRIAKEKAEHYLQTFVSAISKMIASNQNVQEIIKKQAENIYLFGNTCRKNDVFLETNTFKLKDVLLNSVSIEKDGMEANYFFQELKFSFTEAENYPFTPEALERIKRAYNDVDKPERRFDKTIDVMQYSHYCEVNNITYTRYALKINETYEFLENEPRELEYRAFTYLQTRSDNELYGVSTRENVLIRAETIQRRFYDFQNQLEMLYKPNVAKIKDFSLDNTLQTSYAGGFDYNNSVKKSNADTSKDRSMTFELFQELLGSGRFRNQNLEYQELPSNLQIQFQFLMQEIHDFNSSFITFAEEKNNISDLSNDKMTLGEFSQRQAISNIKTKGDFQIMEIIIGSIIKDIMDFSIARLKKEMFVMYQTSGLKNEFEFEEIYLDKNWEMVHTDLYNQIISLDYPLTTKQTLNNPFASLLNEPIEEQGNITITTLNKDYEKLKELYSEAVEQNNKEGISQLSGLIKDFEVKYNNIIKEKFLPALGDKLSKADLERIMLDDFNLPKNIILRAPKEFLYFILSYGEINKKVKFEIASAEANLINNSEVAEFPKYFAEVMQAIEKIPDPSTQIRIAMSLNPVKNWKKVGKARNISDLLEGKELDKAVEKVRQQQIEQQAQMQAVQQQQNPQQNNQQ